MYHLYLTPSQRYFIYDDWLQVVHDIKSHPVLAISAKCHYTYGGNAYQVQTRLLSTATCLESAPNRSDFTLKHVHDVQDRFPEYFI